MRRDGFVEQLYARRLGAARTTIRFRSRRSKRLRSRAREEEKENSPPIEKVFDSLSLTPQLNHGEEDDVDDEEEDVDVDDDRYSRSIDQG